MAYSDFTLDTVRKILGITLQPENLFDGVTEVEVIPWLQETLKRVKEVPLLTEKARSEFLVVPILLTCRELCGNKFAIYSGQRLDVDPQRGLVGECDFILTTTPPLPVLQPPIAIILEPKKGDIEAALGQCAAQMVGARVFNQADSGEEKIIFGCVTTGEDWQFLRLVETTLAIDTRRYYIVNIGRILGIFKAIMAHYPSSSVAA
jgi:hypothetical protein